MISRGWPHRVLLCAALMAPFALLVLLTLGGMRFNRSASFPVGIYRAVTKEPGRGDLVFFMPPRRPVFDLAKERAYIGRGFDPRESELMLKRIVAVADDEISIDATGVTVERLPVPDSVPGTSDPARRAMPVCRLEHYRLRRGEVLVMSDHSNLGFDARYFGPIPSICIRSVVVPVWTW